HSSHLVFIASTPHLREVHIAIVRYRFGWSRFTSHKTTAFPTFPLGPVDTSSAGGLVRGRVEFRKWLQSLPSAFNRKFGAPPLGNGHTAQLGTAGTDSGSTRVPDPGRSAHIYVPE